jgi:hypothetical protein
VDLGRLRAGEWLAGVSGVALLVSLFLPWYDLSLPSAPGAGGVSYYLSSTSASGWEALSVIDVVLALVACGGVMVAILTAAERVPAVPLALSALIAPVALVGVILVLIRALDLPDWAAGRGWALWLGLAGALGVLAGTLVTMRDEVRPDALAPDIETLPAPRP